MPKDGCIDQYNDEVGRVGIPTRVGDGRVDDAIARSNDGAGPLPIVDGTAPIYDEGQGGV